MTVSPDNLLMTDRVALVTGAAQGIGRATASALAAFGARVVVCDRRADPLESLARELRHAGRLALARTLDVRDRDAVRGLVADVVREHGRIDALVNNAGGTFFAPFVELSDHAEETLVAENFTQVTNLVRCVVPSMPRGGAIVNVTSIEGHHAAPGFAVYGAMKAALEHLTKSLALELAPRGIRVNAVAPDAMPTEGEQSVRDDMLAAGAAYEPARVPPLGFLGTADDAAAVVVFLTGPLARFVTGATVHVDGGNWAAGGWRRTDVTA